MGAENKEQLNWEYFREHPKQEFLLKTTSLYSPCGAVRLVHGGREYFTILVQLIREARTSIHLQTYIFNDDQTGKEVADALIQAARNGVRVFMLLDGYASRTLPKEFIGKLKSAGIRFRFFEPIFRSRHFYFGRRLHHKVVVVDEKKALVGGLNIADRYNDVSQKRAWLDLAVLVEDHAAEQLARICEGLWTRRRQIQISRKKRAHVSLEEGPKCQLRICRNDWVMGKHEIFKSYTNLFRHAKHSITILCSYFLPGGLHKKMLKQAVKRGVQVRVVLAGYSDITVVKYAERYLYRWMLRNNIEVYEYLPTVLHAKTAVADEEILTIGSYNINDLSALASIELNIEIKDRELALNFVKEVDAIIKNECTIIHLKKIRIFSFEHFLQFLSYYALSMLLKITTFYFKKQQ